MKALIHNDGLCGMTSNPTILDKAIAGSDDYDEAKDGQGAKTGTGGHLPGNKVVGKIAKVRNLAEGTPAVSPSRFKDLVTVDDFRSFADKVRAISGGIPHRHEIVGQSY